MKHLHKSELMKALLTLACLALIVSCDERPPQPAGQCSWDGHYWSKPDRETGGTDIYQDGQWCAVPVFDPSGSGSMTGPGNH